MKFKFTLALLASLFVVSLLTSCTKDTPEPTPDPGTTNPKDSMMVDDNLEAAPEFSLLLDNGSRTTLADHKGKVLVIFFLGNGCPPCKSVAPSIESELHQRFKSNDKFAILGVDTWDGNESAVAGFKSQTGVTFPLGLKAGSMASKYGMTFDRLIIVNKEGKIAFKDNARRAANTLDEVMAKVNQLL